MGDKKTFKFTDRAAQKQASRDEDQRRLEAGEISASDLREENSFLRKEGFSAKKIGFSPRCRPKNGDRYFSVDGASERDKPDPAGKRKKDGDPD
ncbi:hypothetical protein LCM27_15080 [Ruegeria marisrubri]|uniref:hypothetical protein n=1 Tax=Ruegeria marisrubri TaxID=1685379 RepID=UPI001CD69DFB|nr:hypothetical protein [Ruegeria marisrubri]MCA0907724.1 hypothetical protein [Ruegeria marisrubri]